MLGVGISLAIDMWSVGCILTEVLQCNVIPYWLCWVSLFFIWKLFFGRPLFVAETREDLIESVRTGWGDTKSNCY